MDAPSVDSLIDKVIAANRAYSVGKPLMTDAEYDGLWRQLRDIRPGLSILYHTDALMQTDGLPTIIHPRPLLSLDKCFELKELEKFYSMYRHATWVIQPKYDGVAAAVYPDYNQNFLALAGDGFSGYDITHKTPYIDFQEEFKTPTSGEILIPWERWNSIFGANPRNVVAGWMNPKSSKPFPAQVAMFVPHDTHSKRIEPHLMTVEAIWEALLQYYSEWNTLYPLDGVVIKLEDLNLRKMVGNNDKYPYWAIAWKPPMQIGETYVKEIEWNVSRHGRIVPTVIYNTLELCGTRNNRATGNSANWLLTRRIGEGSKIKLGKAGEIIPKIIQCLTPAELKLPERCPVCEKSIRFDGMDYVCENEHCVAQMVSKINHFYSVIDVKGLGPSTIEELLNDRVGAKLLVQKPWCLLLQTQIVKATLFHVLGPVRAQNVIDAIMETNGVYNIAHVLAAMGNKQVGYKNAMKLIKGDTYGMNWEIVRAGSDILTKVIHISRELKDYGYRLAKLPITGGKVYCITGEFSLPRPELVRLLESLGWEYRTSVSTRTEVVFLGSLPKESTKLATARQLGIPIYGEEKLMEIISENAPGKSTGKGPGAGPA